MLNEWQKWCRLCAKENGNIIDVLVKDENIMNLAEIIQRIFSIEVVSTDGISTTICLDCHKFISEIVNFSERSSRVQSMYSELKFSSNLGTVRIDLYALRQQFGILSQKKYDKNKLISQSTDINNLQQNLVSQKEEFNAQKITNEIVNILDFKNIIDHDDNDDDDDITEIDYLHGDLLEITHEQQLNNDENSKDNSIELKKRKISTRSKKENHKNFEIHNKTEYECEICEKRFIRERNYLYHMKFIHNKNNNNDNKFSCNKCNKKFQSKKRLTDHTENHIHPEITYQCPFCDKSFTKRVYLHSHVRTIHESIKPYICEECGKALGSCGALKEHKYTHIDDTPYHCTQCPKKFKNKARLKIHTDTHNDTAYVCTICGQQLNTRRTLLMHMVIHSDQKNHKCNFCGNEYKRAKALKNHLILHSGLRPYSCPFCEKTFANGSNCRTHKKKSHPNELAALEASGEKCNTTNIPKLKQLKSVSLV